MHPLSGNLSLFKEVELESKIHDLTKKYFLTSNPAIQEQISNLLSDYKLELASRQAKKWQEEYEKRDKDLDSLINID